MFAKTIAVTATGLFIVLASQCPALVAQRPDVDRFLTEGRLQDGVRESQAWLEKHEQDDQAVFGLGLLQFVQGVERLSQDLHRYGLRDVGRRVGFIPFFRLPVPENPNPQPLTYEASREIIAEFIRQFGKAEKTLARVKSP